MSTGNLNLDLVLSRIAEDAVSGMQRSIPDLRKLFPSLTEKEIDALFRMFLEAFSLGEENYAKLVATTPPAFDIKAMSTMNTVRDMLEHANKSILITGYSLSEYFSEMVDCIIQKSQKGVLVKFFVNQIENQAYFERLMLYRSGFLKIYDYPKTDDKMAALHAKVISVDQKKTLITSANLSYHGQEGNIELGALIESQKIAKQVEDIFTKLLFKKVFVEV